MPSDKDNYINLRSQTHSDTFRFWGEFNRIANTFKYDNEAVGALQVKFMDIINDCVNSSYEERQAKNEFICDSLLSYYKSLFLCLPVHIEFIEDFTYINMYPDHFVSMDRFSVGLGLRVSKKEYNLLKLKNNSLLSVFEERFST